MGIIIKEKEQNKIKIKGTSIEIPEIYGRIEFAGRADGKTLEINLVTYASKEEFNAENSSPLATNVLKGASGNFNYKLEDEQEQSLTNALNISKLAIEELGYEVEIDN